MANNDNLDRFIKAQEGIYNTALMELKNGRKQSHWMWFIFPQIDGLGRSDTARYYAIKNKAEAEQYLKHEILGSRLIECTNAVLHIKDRSAADIFGYPDELKFKSSMTLFAMVAPENRVFIQAINQFFQGEQDSNTLKLLENISY